MNRKDTVRVLNKDIIITAGTLLTNDKNKASGVVECDVEFAKGVPFGTFSIDLTSENLPENLFYDEPENEIITALKVTIKGLQEVIKQVGRR